MPETITKIGAGAAPFLSIVIPSYNRCDLLLDGLSRLMPELVPFGDRVEVVIVDDGSTDGTPARLRADPPPAAFCRDSRLRLVVQNNAGPGAARNRGAAEARGTYLAFLDSDDFWMPWTLGQLLAVLEAGPDKPEVIFLQATPFRDPAEADAWTEGDPELVRHPTLLEMRLDARMQILGSCNVVFRRDTFQALGGFTTEVRTGEDTDLFYRAGLAGPVWSITAPTLVAYRAGGADSLTKLADGRLVATRYLLRRHRAGLYPGDPSRVEAALAKTLLFAIRDQFARGQAGHAYRLYLDGAALLRARRDWHNLLRLPLTPLLSLLRPRRYSYRWRG